MGFVVIKPGMTFQDTVNYSLLQGNLDAFCNGQMILKSQF
jgi:hypothetical protein